MIRAYLDNAATTRPLPKVLSAMREAEALFGNPSSIHAAGRAARKALEDARERVAGVLGVDPKEIVFTSTATESDNLALAQGRAPVVGAFEHRAVLEAAPHAPRIRPDGEVPAGADLVSFMLVNNETGETFPVAEIRRRTKARFHCDAVAAAGKIPVRPRELDVDYLTLSAHKIHGPKGIGLLYVRKGAPLAPMIRGGGHEFEKRAGTENVAAAVGFAVALEEPPKDLARLTKRIEDGLRAVPRWSVNGENRAPGVLNVSFEGIDGEALVIALDTKGVCVSTGSACASLALEPSHVLRAMGLSADRVRGAVRFSPAADTTDAEIDYALEQTADAVRRLREISPRWA